MNYEIYTTVDWLMFFYIYCFLGWCFESTYVSLHQKNGSTAALCVVPSFLSMVPGLSSCFS